MRERRVLAPTRSSGRKKLPTNADSTKTRGGKAAADPRGATEHPRRIVPRGAGEFSRLVDAANGHGGYAASGAHQDGLWHRGRPGRRLRAQPSGRKPTAWNGKLAPAAVQANADVRRRGHRWMAHSPRSIAIEPDFGGNGGESFRSTFWTVHGSTSARLHRGMADLLGLATM